MNRSPRAWRPASAAGRAALLASVVLVASAASAYAAFVNAASAGPMTITTTSLTAPTGVAASNPCSSATTISSSLSWTASSSTATTGYSVLRATAPGGPFSSVGTVSGINNTAYTETITHPAAADSVYVATKTGNEMDVVSMGSNTRTGSSGTTDMQAPTNIAVTPDGTKAYLVNSGNTNSVAAVDIATDTPQAQINVGTKAPQGIAITPDGTTAWVADGTGNSLVPITVATNTTGTPRSVFMTATAVAITPDGTTAWVVGGKNVRSLNLSSFALGTTLSPTGASSLQAIAITPDGTKAYIADSGAKKVFSLDLASGQFGTTAISFNPLFAPQALAISPDGTTAWVAGGSDVAPITLSADSPGSDINVGSAVFQGIALSPNGCFAYAADSFHNQLVVIDTASKTQATTIPTHTSPQDVASAYPPISYYYELRSTRNLWTSPVSAQTSLSFGQPNQSS